MATIKPINSLNCIIQWPRMPSCPNYISPQDVNVSHQKLSKNMLCQSVANHVKNMSLPLTRVQSSLESPSNRESIEWRVYQNSLGGLENLDDTPQDMCVCMCVCWSPFTHSLKASQPEGLSNAYERRLWLPPNGHEWSRSTAAKPDVIDLGKDQTTTPGTPYE